MATPQKEVASILPSVVAAIDKNSIIAQMESNFERIDLETKNVYADTGPPRLNRRHTMGFESKVVKRTPSVSKQQLLNKKSSPKSNKSVDLSKELQQV